MTDWSTVSSLATGAGTLVLAAATFASVRSANRTARAAEASRLAGLRPLLVQSRLEDKPEPIDFIDRRFSVPGGRGLAEVDDDIVYLAFAVRNVGSGIAVLDRWTAHAGRSIGVADHEPMDDFRRLTRDLYVPAGHVGFWQGAVREVDDPLFAPLAEAIGDGEAVTVEMLYTDHEGGQRTITRFALIVDDDGQRNCMVSRHWNLDRDDPR